MPIKCPNLRDDSGRAAFNAVLERLGGAAMSADDITPRQPYLARLTEQQASAYHVAHYLWNAHKTPAEIGAFLNALDAVTAALEKPVDIKVNKPQKPPAADHPRQPESGASSQTTEAAPLSNLPAVDLARALLERLRACTQLHLGKWPEATKIPLERVIRGTDYDAADRARARELRNLHKHPWKH